MDDSSLFIQWAMNTLHNHPATAAAAYGEGRDGEGTFPSLQALRNASQIAGGAGLGHVADQRASSWSSGDSSAAMDHDGWSPNTAGRARSGSSNSNNNNNNNNQRPMSWNFSTAAAQPTDESGRGGGLQDAVRAHANVAAAPQAPGNKRGGSGGPTAGAAVTGSPAYVQDHIIAERRRREKINQRFIELSTVIPCLKKMDKATILGDAVKYVRELQEKVKVMEDDHNARSHGTNHSVVLVKKPCIPSTDGGDEDGPPSSSAAAAPAMAGSGGGGTAGLPEIEVRVSESSVLLRIHCENARGLLVRVLSEVEELRLAITHTSVMPFPACTVIITITAKVEEGFNTTVEEIVRRLNSALHQYYSSNSTDETRN